MESPVPTAAKAAPILVKRYARGRLYDATHRRFISLAELRRWAALGVAFVVIDAALDADVTRLDARLRRGGRRRRNAPI